ncbi:hypothetical protein GDO78_009512 [Eleutherodactylus coqui]|uniref:CCDC66 domain-containing protein n=1 Tax=Eleutherodactylus coqui TaxID=57060 RepID=A0A8J6FBL2_ELECQ|nr:hypothetical protein GDO78_009512 [Eleutherodactylus coqui]
MNLGDGLMLETQILNGKPKLIVAPYGVQDKMAKQAGNKGRTHKTSLKGKNPAQVLHAVQNNNAKTEQPVLKGRSAVGALPPGKPPANVLKELENKHQDQNVQQTRLDPGPAKPVPKKISNMPRQRQQQKPSISAEELRESLVCLTQEQFQKILMTINQGSKPVTTDQAADNDEEDRETKGENIVENEEEVNSELAEKNDLPTTEQTNAQIVSLFSALGERERDKSLQEAKKAQWRRELDEQVALKKKLKEAENDGINLRHREAYGRESSVSERTLSSDLLKNTPFNDYSTPDQEDPMLKTSTGTETSESSPYGRASSFSSPELPAAIRSAFVLGEAAPLDHPFSAVKRQQQKKWLEELNKQREEDAMRKMEEKQKLQENVQQDHWAMHFDSFKKQKNFCQNTMVLQQFENPQATSDPMENIPSPSSHRQQEQFETMKAAEQENVQSQKTGFLRTMTSLLDPVQIEERDRKRLKQLEHQEVLDLKTKELYHSMQRAQEEAQRLKQEQRIRHLLQKGHDISNLQKSVADDLNFVMKPDPASYYKETTWRHERNASPDIPIEFKNQSRKAEVQIKKSHVKRDRNDSSKENTDSYSDVYDQFARTEKQGKEHGRRPDWNKNRPQKKYIPASDRYPRGLQKQREENKMRRQMELLHLVERNSNNLHLRKVNSPEKPSVPREEAKISAQHEDIKTIQEVRKQEDRVQKVESSFKRSDSPPVPAVKNRLNHAQKRSTPPLTSVYNGNTVSIQRHVTPDLEKLESDRPPSSRFVPYVRTKEIYYLDPHAPMSRPSTHEPQHNLTGNDQESLQMFSTDHARDPLLNPNVIRNKDRQQAILRGLSELRKGLLQKQRELETGLIPDI